MPGQHKPLRKSAARQDRTYGRILQAFCDLLLKKTCATKEEVLKDAQASAWAAQVRWNYLIEFISTENPGVMILSLNRRYFISPRIKEAHSVDPGKYLAPNYTVAKGFASVAQFVQMSERNRAIAQAKYTQQQIAAAMALESAERFNAAIAPPAAMLAGA
jgi:hypothetical protein